MAKFVIDEATLTAIAESIRTKKGTAEAINPEDMAAEILAIVAGENLDAVLTEQEALIAELKEVLIDKAAGVGKYEVWTITYVDGSVEEIEVALL